MIVHRTNLVEHSIGMDQPKLDARLNERLADWWKRGYECVGIHMVTPYEFLLLLRDREPDA